MISKSTIPAGTVTTQPIATVDGKKMLVKTPHHVLPLNDTNHTKLPTVSNSTAKLENSNDHKMVQMPLTEYLELKKTVQILSKQNTEILARMTALEKHCGLR